MLLHSRKLYTVLTISLISFTTCTSKNKNRDPSNTTRIDTSKFYPVGSKDSLEFIYDSTLSYLWKKFVPEAGQAATVQGELVRIIEKLDHEIAGNAKANWDTQFVYLAHYLRDTLIGSGIFSQQIKNEIYTDVDFLSRSENEVYTEDYYYDRLRRRIVEWYWRNRTPRNHTFNPELYR